MSIKAKAGIYTALIVLGLTLFFFLCLVTDGAAFMLAVLAVPTFLIYTLILDNLESKERKKQRLRTRGY